MYGFLIGGSQHHLGTASLALCCGMRIQRFRREVLRLLQDIVIEVRQDAGVEADVVLHQQNHLHTGLADVMLNVHLIFYQLDDGEDEVRVAQPTEHIVEGCHILILDALGDTMRERCQHHNRDIGGHFLDVASYGKRIVVGITRHTDDQVDVRFLQHLVGLLGGRNLCERRRITESQIDVLGKNLLIHTSVILQHEGIVGVGHYQHIEDTACHQVHERHVLQEKVIELRREITVHLLCFIISCQIEAARIPYSTAKIIIFSRYAA